MERFMLEEVPKVSLSVVSHRNGSMIEKLFSDLRRTLNCSYEILLTINVKEDLSFIKKFSDLHIIVIHNDAPKGFGANHNAAFQLSRSPSFVIVNPDIRLHDFDFESFLKKRDVSNLAALGAVIKNPDGKLEDSARRHPTFISLFLRFFTRWRSDHFRFSEGLTKVDWLAGMFICFDRAAFAAVGGFDEGYFMYLEDADIGRKLHAAGQASYVCSQQYVIHDAQRASKRDLTHLKWHLSSAFRYFYKHGLF
jgi:N-acetylglucosaminyl-diphospho-decaprenol L-rhamnosyltransferase